MRVTHAGLVEIEQSEGFSSKPYLDKIASPPVWTIGFGETDGIGPNTKPITRAEGERRLKARFERDYAWALKPFEELKGFTQNMYDALASFVWNCGVGAVSAATKVGRRLRARDWRGATQAMMAWVKAGGRVIQGLVNRRRREVALFLKAVGHTAAFYLTVREREVVATLAHERRVAKRHGGWDRVSPTHVRAASAAKRWLRDRVAVLSRLPAGEMHRRQRIAALREAIG
jgi:lysozyme